MDTVEDSPKALKHRAGEILSEWLRTDKVILHTSDKDRFPRIIQAMQTVELLRDTAESLSVRFVEVPLLQFKTGDVTRNKHSLLHEHLAELIDVLTKIHNNELFGDK